MRLKLLLNVVLLLLSLTTSFAQETRTLTVFAAASLTDAFEEIATEFESANPSVEVVYNFGGSSALATQLVEGASGDIFASANARQMQLVEEAGLLGGTPRTFVKNRLVVVVPVDNPANIETLADLSNEGVKLVVAAPDVPVREYTETMLDRMSANPLYGEGFKSTVLGNVVSEEDNVRQVVVKVALGEADAGIVYLSDITQDVSTEVQTLPIPDLFNTIATYPIAALADSPNPELAQAFVDYVLSDVGQDILVEWGFISVRIPEEPSEINLNTDGYLRIEGQVLNTLNFSPEDLRTGYPTLTVEVSYLSGEETVTASYTGVLLWEIVNAAQLNTNADVRNDKLSFYIVATGRDGYQSVISWAEIDPEYSNQPILIAFQQDGVSFLEEDGLFRLVVPTDEHGGRYIRGLVNLSVRDAPTAK
jgi:molybdate transport system substrate-binding protein